MRKDVRWGLVVLCYGLSGIGGIGGIGDAAPRSMPTLEKDDLGVPALEVGAGGKAPLPAVPDLRIPVAEGDAHDVRELRVHRALFGSEVKVRGYVTWIYDCALVIATPGQSRADAQDAVEQHPERCERPKFYLGATANARPEQAIWIVDVPRRPFKLERKNMSPEQEKQWPAVPALAIGDYVIVTGAWVLQSPHGERNSDGLLVYKSLVHARPVAPVAPVTASTQGATLDLAVVTVPPLRKVVDYKVEDESILRYKKCDTAYANQQLALATAECRAAIETWDGNHNAWYLLGGIYARTDWRAARDALAHTVELRPDVAAYQLLYGRFLYEAAKQDAREELARVQHKQPAAVTPDLSPAQLEPAIRALATAAKLCPGAWEPPYHLGRIYRELGRPRDAAEAFTAAIQADPRQASPYVAILELYRFWNYLDEALAVAELATANVAGSDAADVWYELGMVRDARLLDRAAIAAFAKAIELRPDHVKAKFQRGQVYFRVRDFVKAKRDLTDYLAANDPSSDFARAQANALLQQMSR